MTTEEIKTIAEKYFEDTSFLDFKQEQDTKVGFRIGLMYSSFEIARLTAKNDELLRNLLNLINSQCDNEISNKNK